MIVSLKFQKVDMINLQKLISEHYYFSLLFLI